MILQPPLKSRWHLHNYSHGEGRKEGGLKHFRGHLPGTRTSVALPAGGREQTLVVGKSVSPSYFVSVAPPPRRHLERYLAIILGNLLFVAFKYKMLRLRAQAESRGHRITSHHPTDNAQIG